MKNVLFSLSLLFFSTLTSANETSEKGLLKDVSLGSDSEEENQRKAVAGELLISKAEDSAIKALEKILIKKKGTSEESELQLRLAELYIRKAKTGRFFDLYRSSLLSNAPLSNSGKDSSLKNNPTLRTSAKPFLLKAIAILGAIEKKDPKFSELSTVLFNIAFASQAISDSVRAHEAYTKIVQRFPTSAYAPDALLSLGEMSYGKGDFQKSIDYFDQLKKWMSSKAYPYGMYKAAWASYNLRHNDEAIQRLMLIVQSNDLGLSEKNAHNLRKESLHDLVLFTSETLQPEELSKFFKKLCSPDEYSEMMIVAAKLYESHSRHKELITMMNSYIEKSDSKAESKAEALVFVVDAHESLKQRKEVLVALKRFADLCNKDLSDEKLCYKHFRHSATEISKKWWDIWEKNKLHKEFSELTEQALEIVLSEDQNRSEDAKTRLSYADLLFQQEKFERASVQYARASRYEKLETPLRQEALYSALIALDKTLEKEKLQVPKNGTKNESKLSSKTIELYTTQLDLSKYYVSNFSEQKYYEDVLFKKGFLEYQLQNFPEALTTLRRTQKLTKNVELKERAQDLAIDILNIDKKYSEIKQDIQSYLKEKVTPSRSEQLRNWLEEAEFADLNTKAKDSKEKISKLENFIKEYPNSKLVKKSKQLLIPLYFDQKEDLKASEIAFSMKEGTKDGPDLQDKEKILKLSAESFMLAGQNEKAYDLLKQFELTSACEFLQLLQEKARAKGCYLGLVDSANKSQREKAIQFLFTNLPGDDKDLIRISRQIESQNTEPWSTDIQLKRARSAIQDKNFPLAFDLARKIMNKDISANQKAKARLIQAQILEGELRLQSVKTRADRLATVLSMKTEKLDKAHTAYFSTSKMTEDKETLIEAFSGIQRCYDDYISSLEDMPTPQGVAPEEVQALKNELAKLLEPMKQKRSENSQRLKDLGANSFVAEGTEPNWIRLVDFAKFKTGNEKTDFEARVHANVLTLMSAGKFELAEIILTKSEKLFDAPKWVFELLILENATVNNFDKISDIFAKKFFDKNLSTEVEIAKALSLSQKGKYQEFLKIFSNFSKEIIYNYSLEELHINSATQTGDKKLALNLIDDYSTLAQKKKNGPRLQRLKLSREKLQNEVAKDESTLREKKR